MKKLFVILAAVALVWAFAAPASAVDWNFYGSARVETSWRSSDGGDASDNGINGSVEDSELTWGDVTGSRFGARAKGENVSGLAEFKMQGDGSGGDGTVTAKHLYGEWDFGAGKLLVGKTYAGDYSFISTQMYDGDTGLLGLGAMYGGRPYQIALTFGGLRIALADPDTSLSATPKVFQDQGTVLGTIPGLTTGDTDQVIPKIVVRYGMSFDAFSFNVFGGYQHWEIEDAVSSVDGSTNDIDVDSWMLGGDAEFGFGPAYVRAALSYAQNGGNARWATGAGVWDGDDDIVDNDTIMGALVAGFKMSDMVTFEGGFGYREDELDTSGAKEDETFTYYVNATVGLAPGVWIIPEIGMFDFADDESGTDEGDAWYAGAKWQIDF
jgi:hypothetical protein